MSEPKGVGRPKREYPAILEKGVPIALGVLVVLIAIVIIFIVAVTVGLVPPSP